MASANQGAVRPPQPQCSSPALSLAAPDCLLPAAGFSLCLDLGDWNGEERRNEKKVKIEKWRKTDPELKTKVIPTLNCGQETSERILSLFVVCVYVPGFGNKLNSVESYCVVLVVAFLFSYTTTTSLLSSWWKVVRQKVRKASVYISTTTTTTMWCEKKDFSKAGKQKRKEEVERRRRRRKA